MSENTENLYESHEEWHQVTRTQWRVVNDANRSIPFSINADEVDARGRAHTWLVTLRREPHHLELWEQTYKVTKSEWRQIQ